MKNWKLILSLVFVLLTIGCIKELTPGCKYNMTACNENFSCINNSCILKTGCQYANPACDQNHFCTGNSCILKSGCYYGNPSCNASQECINNQCILKQGCDFNNPACEDNQICSENVCITKPGCQYNNPTCGQSYECINNSCIFTKLNCSGIPTQNTDVVICMMRWDSSYQKVNVANMQKMTQKTADYFRDVSYCKLNLTFHFVGDTLWQGDPPDGRSGQLMDAVPTCDKFVDFAAFSNITWFIIYPSQDNSNIGGYPLPFDTDEGTKYLSWGFISKVNNEDFKDLWDSGTFIHEMGHVAGLGHAHALDCDSDSYRANYSSCVSGEYDNPFDVMGIPEPTGQFDGWSQVKLGWSTPREIIKDGVYKLSALEVPSTEPQVLHIPYAGMKHVCIDYRKPIGQDNFAAKLDKISSGETPVNEHIVRLLNVMDISKQGCLMVYVCNNPFDPVSIATPDGTGTNYGTWVIDTTPTSESGTPSDLGYYRFFQFADACLPENKSFTNDALGLSVSFTVNPNLPDTADVSVDIDENKLQ